MDKIVLLKNKILFTALLGLIALITAIVGCVPDTQSEPATTPESSTTITSTTITSTTTTSTTITVEPQKFRFYYYRSDSNYSGWGVHFWNQSGWGPTSWASPMTFAEGGVSSGSPALDYSVGDEAVAGLNFKYIEFFQTEPYNLAKDGIMFIVHKGDTKDTDGDRLWPSTSLYKNIYIKQGDSTVYELKGGALQVINYILTANIINSTTIQIGVNAGYDQSNDTFKVFKDGVEETGFVTSFTAGATTGNLVLNSPVDFSKNYTIQFRDQNPVMALVSPKFIDTDLTPSVDEQLGLVFSGSDVTFKVWAPTASNVRLNLYDGWDQAVDSPTSFESMTRGADGVWSVKLSGLTTKYYQYEIYYGAAVKRGLDPYAKSMAMFKESSTTDYVGKGAIINPKDHNPSGWSYGSYASLPDDWKREDAIIYEVHVRDFTSDPDITTTAQFGTYKAFIEKISYLKELGVTHIQLLPVMSYYYGDETLNAQRENDYSYHNNNYNWGYDPHNYFTPEGMYSENPDDPALRIKELKELIKAIHDNGMAVILDCVYNHTANRGVLENFAPGYYYRVDASGNYTNASGCGNDVESSHKMVRKLITDSLKYWVEEYNVDGFRFDLMGIIDNRTILEGYNKCAALNPKVLFVGEGWKQQWKGPATDYLGQPITGMDQDQMNTTNNVAVFSDQFRDILKGGGFNEGAKAFLSTAGKGSGTLLNIYRAQPTNIVHDAPGDSLQYMTAHDGLTLYDALAYSMRLVSPSQTDSIHTRSKIGNLFLLLSQGIPFIHAGCEMGRTKEYVGNPADEGWTSANHDVYYDSTNNKYYVRNSYDSSDAINKIDWSLIADGTKGKELMEYTKKLIQLRKSTIAFRYSDMSSVNSNVSLINCKTKYPFSSRYIGFKNVDNVKNETYFVFMNADLQNRTFDQTADDLSAVTLIGNISDINLTTGFDKTTWTASGIDLSDDNLTLTLSPLSVAIFKK